ncbi:hypothetical protein A1OE_714 [Candidatus Endolissoclinum faulkneri L2]|uniref:Uncharacterized protein n=1 Tax=Candidatus Endolissoclinum faulkneri L2 TaxID=1193729 RepID=K7YN27_9PROT|nr:hypothetical protein A1OE_714 [Candidatus Endolissoclinum faulkneri L2]
MSTLIYNYNYTHKIISSKDSKLFCLFCNRVVYCRPKFLILKNQ